MPPYDAAITIGLGYGRLRRFFASFLPNLSAALVIQVRVNMHKLTIGLTTNSVSHDGIPLIGRADERRPKERPPEGASF